MKEYLKECDRYGPPLLPLAIIGTKTDILSHRMVSKDELKVFTSINNIYDFEEFAEKSGCFYGELSSRTGENVEELMKTLAEKVWSRF